MMLSNCPVCGDPLLNEYLGVFMIKQKCTKRLDHWIEIKSKDDWGDNGKVYQITVRISDNPRTLAVWYPMSNELQIHRETSKRPLTVPITALPYFIPDLYDYPKLINKIKMALIFS